MMTSCLSTVNRHYYCGDGGEDDLDFYRRIIDEAPFYLSHGGLLIMEIGYNQAERVKDLLENEGLFS